LKGRKKKDRKRKTDIEKAEAERKNNSDRRQEAGG
jgi:hypothetical protein